MIQIGIIFVLFNLILTISNIVNIKLLATTVIINL